MKNYILFLFTILVIISSCKDEQRINVPFLEIKPEEKIINMPIEGGSWDVTVHSNLDIIQIVSQDVGGYSWCTYSLGMTASNIHVFNINVAKNDGIGVRQADFILKGNGVKNDTIHIRQLGTEPAIFTNITSKYLTNESQEFNIEITSNVDYKQVISSDWLQLKSTQGTRNEMITNSFTYTVSANDGFAVRRDTIFIESSSLQVKVSVEQKGADIDDVIPEDVKVKVESVKRTQGNCFQESTGVYAESKTIDGDLGTAYASANSSNNENIIMEYSLASSQNVDYILIYPMKGSNDLNKLTTGTIRYKKSKQDIGWIECGDFKSEDKTAIVRIDVNLNEVSDFQLELKRSGPNKNNNVNFAEFECYQLAEGKDFDLFKDAEYFEDNVFSKLKSTTTIEDIKNMTHPMVRAVARELLNGTYSTEFRSRNYKSCKNPQIVGTELTIGKRSICDNPTGIFFEKGKKYIIFVGNELGNDKMKLYIKDWSVYGGSSQTVSLISGLNIVETTTQGNGYIQYWTETNLEIPKSVNVHICYGIELGFWDVRQHDNDDWKRILKNAVDCVAKENIENAMFDACGELVQLVNKLDAFNTYCPNDIVSVMNKHDELMAIEYTMMGLYKYNAVPKNRILGVRSFEGSPNWNGTQANIPNREETMLTVAGFLRDLWVYGHEFGHGNQINQMRGGGWGEVSNNIYAGYIQYSMNNELRLEHEAIDRRGYGNEKVIGDRFNGYLNDALVSGVDYLKYQGEWEYQNGEKYHGADPFTTLCPLWQLSLLFEFTQGNSHLYRKDFWADVHWAAIQNVEGTDYENFGQRHVNFMKRSMKAANMNMTKFFENIGLLRELDFPAAAYGNPDHILITKAMVDDVKEYAKQFPNPQPETLEMNYISGNTVEIYRQQLPMSGIYGKGITNGEEIPNTKIVSHLVWKNVVAYETIDANGKMIEVCIAGTGSESNTTTLIRYPEGSTGIRAVSWDGKREMVYGE